MYKPFFSSEDFEEIGFEAVEGTEDMAVFTDQAATIASAKVQRLIDENEKLRAHFDVCKAEKLVTAAETERELRLELSNRFNEIRSLTYTVDQLKASMFAAAKTVDRNERLKTRIAKLEGALRSLLNDTQHSEHNCNDELCPVFNAKEVLEGKE